MSMSGRVRLATADDAGRLLDLQHRLDVQSSSMLLEPGERDRNPDQLEARLGAQGRTGSFDLVTGPQDASTDLAGWLAVEVAPFRRAQHVGYVVLGVDADFAGRGLGRGMLAAATSEAQRRGLERLELTVMCDNTRAISLYAGAGYEIEGRRRRSIRRDGIFVDEHYMALLLPGSPASQGGGGAVRA
jgi:ribosomal protein S18 acetylase RimI-like enzyme